MCTLIVDAHNLAYRAWYSPEVSEHPELAADLFIRVLQDEARAVQAERRVAAVELGRSFRFDLFDNYKAGRKEKTPELRAFLTSLPGLSDAAGFEVWHAPGFEADDVMATLARTLDGEVFILTTDQDLYGCVNERVRILPPRKSGEARVFIGMAEVQEKLGVPPELIPLYKALVGDSSDSIPGVQGMGKVKALPLLQRYRSLNALYDNLAVLDPPIRALLERTPRNDVELYHRLTTLAFDAPVTRLPATAVPTAPEQRQAAPPPTWTVSWEAQPGAEPPPATPVTAVLSFLGKHETADGGAWSEDWREEWPLADFDEDEFAWYLRVLADADCPPDVLVKLDSFDQPALCRMIAWHRHCPPLLLRKYRESGDISIQSGASSSPERPMGHWVNLDRLQAQDLQDVLAPLDNADRQVYLASNPTTPAEQLLDLAGEGLAVRLALAARMNAPYDLWKRLAGDSSTAVRQRVAGNPCVPPSALMLLRHDEAVHLALAGNPAIGDDLQGVLAELNRSDVQQALAGNPSFTRLWKLGYSCKAHTIQHQLATPIDLWWTWLNSDCTLEEQRLVARHAAGAFPLLPELASHADVALRCDLARNPACPEEVLRALSKDTHASVRSAVAVHAACPPDCLQALKEDPHWHVRRMASESFTRLIDDLDGVGNLPWHIGRLMASHASCPAAVLERLAGHPDWRVQVAVARHAACPQAVLIQLADSHVRTVQLAAAGNWRLPAEVLARLAGSDHLHVRAWVASHAHTPAEALLKLAQDATWDVRVAAAGNPQLPLDAFPALLTDDQELIRQLLAANTQHGDRFLVRLGRDTSWAVRFTAAQNQHSPGHLLNTLAGDSHFKVRLAVASHSNAPLAALDALSEDDTWQVRQAAARHPRCPLHLLEQLAADDDYDVRRAVAGNAAAIRAAGDSTDLSYLEWLAEDDDDSVIAGVFMQPVASRPVKPGVDFPPDMDDDDLIAVFREFPEAPLDVIEENFHALPLETQQQLLERQDLPSACLSHLLSQLTGEAHLSIPLMRHPSLPAENALQVDEALSTLARTERARLMAAPSTRWLDLPAELTGLFWDLAVLHEPEYALVEEFRRAEDWHIREAVALNPSIPFFWLVDLAGDDDSDVACAVAKHPATPPGALRQLISEWNSESILTAVAAHPALPEEVIGSLLQGSAKQLKALAQNEALPAYAQIFLASSPDENIRSALGTHPHLIPEARRRLQTFHPGE